VRITYDALRVPCADDRKTATFMKDLSLSARFHNNSNKRGQDEAKKAKKGEASFPDPLAL
jgi:hypothetical protein